MAGAPFTYVAASGGLTAGPLSGIHVIANFIVRPQQRSDTPPGIRALTAALVKLAIVVQGLTIPLLLRGLGFLQK